MIGSLLQKSKVEDRSTPTLSLRAYATGTRIRQYKPLKNEQKGNSKLCPCRDSLTEPAVATMRSPDWASIAWPQR